MVESWYFCAYLATYVVGYDEYRGYYHWLFVKVKENSHPLDKQHMALAFQENIVGRGGIGQFKPVNTSEKTPSESFQWKISTSVNQSTNSVARKR